MSKEFIDQIAELQSRIVFQEDALQKLSDALYNQQKRMDDMEQKIAHLKNELEKGNTAGSSESTGDELPPHY